MITRVKKITSRTTAISSEFDKLELRSVSIAANKNTAIIASKELENSNAELSISNFLTAHTKMNRNAVPCTISALHSGNNMMAGVATKNKTNSKNNFVLNAKNKNAAIIGKSNALNPIVAMRETLINVAMPPKAKKRVVKAASFGANGFNNNRIEVIGESMGEP
jgi:hypothetical protein